MVHRFSNLEIDEDRREVRGGGQTLTLQPKVFDLLAFLARHRERVVPKDELLDTVWSGTVVADASLQRAISLARAALTAARTRVSIRTYARHGYRLCTGEVETEDRSALDPVPTAPGMVAPPPSAAPRQDIRFLRTPDGTALAYADGGRGHPLVKAANWLSHLEYDHQSPIWRHWWRALSERYRLIRYDERGCGLSSWDVADFCLDAWVADLEAVVDALQLEHFALLGLSQGASVAIEYAARHPERVSHLVLYGGFVQGRMKRTSTLKQRQEALMLLRLIRLGWGDGTPAFQKIFASLFMPRGTPEEHQHFIDLQRVSCSAANAEKFIRAFGAIDVTARMPQVTAPTLVLHARDEQEIPLEQARLMASRIANARLVLLESDNHILKEDEPAWQRFVQEVADFLPRPEAGE